MRVHSDDQIWKITLKTKVKSQNNLTIIRVAKPKTTANLRLISQQVYQPDFKVVQNKQSNKVITAKAIKPGLLDFYTTYQLRREGKS